jgi:Cu/Ag efflux pump CusA
MSWIISTALRLRVLVIALAILLVVVGIRTADDIPLDVFPEFAPPIVEVQTEAPGISTPDVESLVTVPIEDAMRGVPFAQRIRSKSVLGLSSVQLIFKEGTDVLTARQLVQERLAVAAQRLPRAARPPVIVPPVSSLSRVLKIGLSSQKLSQMDMTVLCKWTIRPRLMAVPGVANVAIWGEHDRQFQVLVDPDYLRAHDLTLDAVVHGAADATVVASGGFIDTPNQRCGTSRPSGGPRTWRGRSWPIARARPCTLATWPRWASARRRRSATPSSTTGRGSC